MKKIAKFLMIAAACLFTLAACEKDPNKPDDPKDPTDQPDDPTKPDTPSEDVKLAIDGKFADWDDVDAIEGSEGILLMKAQYTDDKLYFYFEGDASVMKVDNVPYANYLTLCFDAGGDASLSSKKWGDEDSGVTYDLQLQFWIMQGGKVNFANWEVKSLTSKGKVENGVVKAEFSFKREPNSADQENYDLVNTTLKAKKILFGAYMTDNTVEHDEDGQELWLGGDDLGQAPLAGSELVVIKKSNL